MRVTFSIVTFSLHHLQHFLYTINNNRSEVEYTERNGKAVKIVTTYKQKTVVKSSNKYVENRKRNWQPFGRCTDPELHADYGSNKPVRAEENVVLEVNKEKQMKQVGRVDLVGLRGGFRVTGFRVF